MDPRLDKVLRTVNQLVADAGGRPMSADDLLSVVVALAGDVDARRAFVSIVYDAVKIADRIDVDAQEPRLTRQLIASLDTRESSLMGIR